LALIVYLLCKNAKCSLSASGLRREKLLHG
jgi:hypothetical protein